MCVCVYSNLEKKEGSWKLVFQFVWETVWRPLLLDPHFLSSMTSPFGSPLPSSYRCATSWVYTQVIWDTQFQCWFCVCFIDTFLVDGSVFLRICIYVCTPQVFMCIWLYISNLNFNVLAQYMGRLVCMACICLRVGV